MPSMESFAARQPWQAMLPLGPSALISMLRMKSPSPQLTLSSPKLLCAASVLLRSYICRPCGDASAHLISQCSHNHTKAARNHDAKPFEGRFI